MKLITTDIELFAFMILQISRNSIIKVLLDPKKSLEAATCLQELALCPVWIQKPCNKTSAFFLNERAMFLLIVLKKKGFVWIYCSFLKIGF